MNSPGQILFILSDFFSRRNKKQNKKIEIIHRGAKQSNLIEMQHKCYVVWMFLYGIPFMFYSTLFV